MIRLGQTITIQQLWSACSQVRICKKPHDGSSRSVRPISLRTSRIIQRFFFPFSFFCIRFFFNYSKLGSKRIGEKTTLQGPPSAFGAPPEPFPNITSIGNTSELHSIAICFAVACANALLPDFHPFVFHLPLQNPPSSSLFFHSGILPSLIFPIFVALTPTPLLSAPAGKTPPSLNICICVTSRRAATSDLLRMGCLAGEGVH